MTEVTNRRPEPMLAATCQGCYACSRVRGSEHAQELRQHIGCRWRAPPPYSPFTAETVAAAGFSVGPAAAAARR